MASVTTAIKSFMEALLYVTDQVSPFWGLTAISILSGIGMVWVLGKTTNQAGLERARDLMISAVYEVRLYLDSPRRMFRSQGRLLWWGMRYTAYMLPAFIVLAIPLGLLLLHLDLRYGVAPLDPGQTVVVRMALADGADGYAVEPQANLSGLAVTAPPLFDEDARAVYLRVKVTEPGTHVLQVKAGDTVVEKEISADPGARRMSPERSAGLANLWAWGAESALPSDGPIENITLSHDAKDDRWLLLPMPWWVYWLLVSMIAAFAVRKRLGVTF